MINERLQEELDRTMEMIHNAGKGSRVMEFEESPTGEKLMNFLVYQNGLSYLDNIMEKIAIEDAERDYLAQFGNDAWGEM